METVLTYRGIKNPIGLGWQGEAGKIKFSSDEIRKLLLELTQPIYAVDQGGSVGLASGGTAGMDGADALVLGTAPAINLDTLGDPEFRKTYGTRYSYYSGAMASGISSERLVIALGKAGLIGSFGAGGVSAARVESAIGEIKAALPEGPFAFNLLNSPTEPALEQRTVDIYLKRGIHVVEASAYLTITVPMVQYRLSGLSQASDGSIVIGNRLIAKLSRLEMAQRFLDPAPDDIVADLLAQGKITPLQAELSKHVPMADDITVEADSGGHTDNRPMICMIPAFIALRDQVQAARQYAQLVRIGTGGGIGTPEAALAAFTLGAAYVVTGSVNQACVESGQSAHMRNLLTQMDMADVAMAPASDMFEMGVKVQVIKRGTMYAMRAQKLYELYSRYNSWEEVPQVDREKLEKTVFKRDFDSIWEDTKKFFMERDPHQIERGESNPRDKMALVFRWYLGLSSRWSAAGEKGREMDYQAWCGPSMGAFNRWVKGTYLEPPQNRHVVDVALQILTGCAVLTRIRALEAQGVIFPSELRRVVPTHPLA